MNVVHYLNNKTIPTFILVLLAYLFSVIVIGSIFGEAIAGYYGAFITCFGGALLKKLKLLTLSTVPIEKREVSINISKVNFFNVLLTVFSFFGMQLVFLVIFIYLSVKANLQFDTTDFLAFFDNGFIVFCVLLINVLSFFLTGYIFAKTSTHINYLGAILTAAIIIVLNTIMGIVVLLLFSINITDDTQPFKDMLPVSAIWIVYIGLMYLGAYAGFSNRQFDRGA